MRIHKLQFEWDTNRTVWYVKDRSGKVITGLFDSEGEAALWIYNTNLVCG